MKLNRGALKFCGVYTVLFILTISTSLFSKDPKGGIVFGQLLMAPILAPLSWSGLLEFIPVDSWMNNVFLFFPFCLVIVYFIGWAISGITNFRDPSDSVGEDTPDWHKR